jgi:hypothetical protein
VCEGGARNPASLRAFHSPDFPPALAGGSPPWAGPFSPPSSPNFLPTRPNGKQVCEQPRRNHGWGPRASARGNPVCEGGTRNPASLVRFIPRISPRPWPGAPLLGALYPPLSNAFPRDVPNANSVWKWPPGQHGWGPRASARGNPVCEGGARNPASLRAFHSPDFPPALAGGSPPWAGPFSPPSSPNFLPTRPNGKQMCERPRRNHGWGPRASARGNLRTNGAGIRNQCGARLGPSPEREGSAVGELSKGRARGRRKISIAGLPRRGSITTPRPRGRSRSVDPLRCGLADESGRGPAYASGARALMGRSAGSSAGRAARSCAESRACPIVPAAGST